MDLAVINKKFTSTKWTPLLLYVSLATTIGAPVPSGYLIGVMNTPAQFIKAWFIPQIFYRYGILLNDDDADLLSFFIVSLFIIGGIFGSLFAGQVTNRCGRRGCLMISGVLMLISGLLFTFCRAANSVEMLLVGRFLGGISSAFIYTVHSAYLMELAPAELRGSLGVLTAVGVTGGVSLAQVVSLKQLWGTEEMWHHALGFQMWLVIIGFIGSPWYPESPSGLFLKNNTEKAREELLRLRGKNELVLVNTEISEMELTCKVIEEKISLTEILNTPEYSVLLFLVCFLRVALQLSGVNAIFFYSIQIFTKAGFSTENAAWMNLGAGFLNFFMTSLSPLIVARFNRRFLLILSSLGCCGAHVGLAFGLFYIDYASWLPILCILFLIIFFTLISIGLGPIPFFIGTELFEAAARPVAMSSGSFFSWCGSFVIGMFFPMVQKIWGSFVFLPCASICLLTAVITYRYLPETRGRDPADIKYIMRKGFRTKI